MFRRTIILAVAALAMAATPALACQWHSQMKAGSATSARAAGACSVGGARGVKGQPTAGVAEAGSAKVRRAVKVTGGDIAVTVTVSGGSTQLNSVSVGYYAH
jgi:hypothetical protein